MLLNPAATLRKLAALLITLSGTCQVAALWLRELTGASVIDALLGAVYLIIGIGLFGQSRFTLFMAIVVPAASTWYVLTRFPGLGPIYEARLATDSIVILCSLVVLWQVRHQPSV